jgi:type IV fimbrial biogenesis protein FimT
MITIAVLAILLTIAVPSFTSMIRASQLTSTSNELLGTLQLARTEALRRNRRVVVCASNDGLACSSSSNWSNGWLVFQDSNANGVVDAGETVIRSHAAVAPLSVLASANIASAVVFRADGLARVANGALLGGRLAVCHPSATPVDNVRDVTIVTGARANVARRSSAGACTQPSS